MTDPISTVRTPPPVVTCPRCGGKRTVLSFIEYIDNPGSAGTEPCCTCGGKGHIDAVTAAQIAEGNRRRTDRLGRGLNVRQEAQRLDITPSRLSRIERGEL